MCFQTIIVRGIIKQNLRKNTRGILVKPEKKYSKLKEKIKQQTSVYNKIPESQKSALHASYLVAL